MAKSTNQQIAEHFRALAALYDEQQDSKSPKGKSKKDEPAEDVEDTEDEEIDAPTREEVESLGIKDLRNLAKQYGIDATKKAEILEAFEDLYDEDDDDEDEDDEDVEEADEDDDEEDEDEEELDRDDLEEMSLKELRTLAKEQGHSAADYKGMDQDALIDLIMGDDDDEEDEEDEDEDEDDDDDEDVEELDEDALNEMSQKELVELAGELDIKVPANMKKNSAANKKKLVNLILDSGEDED